MGGRKFAHTARGRWKMAKKHCRKKKDKDTEYAHNPRYSMILPDATKPGEEDISSTGQS